MSADGDGGREGRAEVMTFLRRHEAQLAAVRPARPAFSSAAAATGWAASKAKLLDEACRLARGHERALALQQRWGALLISMIRAVDAERMCALASGLFSGDTLVELAMHPHGVLVLQAQLRSLAALLALPAADAPPADTAHTQGEERGRRAVQRVVAKLYDAASRLLDEQTLPQVMCDARGSVLLRDIICLAAGCHPPQEQDQPKREVKGRWQEAKDKAMDGPHYPQVHHECMRACMYAYMHACVHTYIHTYTHTYMHACIHTYIHTHIHTYIHTHTYMHT